MAPNDVERARPSSRLGRATGGRPARSRQAPVPLDREGAPNAKTRAPTHGDAGGGDGPRHGLGHRGHREAGIRGRLSERTTDWYTQDRQGNVWYFGEDTAVLDASGHVTSREGSWRAGVGTAKPGIYMPAHPTPGQSGRQEYLKGQAQDHFQVLSLRAAVAVPYTSSTRALLTKEWTPLEPGVLDHKLYLRGVGTALEQSVKGGTERLELVSVRHGTNA